MRKAILKIDEVIEKIQSLKGQSVGLKVTRGRKKTEEIKGIIENIYPSIFTIKSNGTKGSLSYSYADVLCGDVVLLESEDKEAANNF